MSSITVQPDLVLERILSIEIVRVTERAAVSAARLRGRPYIFNFDKVREARAGSWTCSSQTIRGELGFRPQAPLPDRLRQTADWYRGQNWL